MIKLHLHPSIINPSKESALRDYYYRNSTILPLSTYYLLLTTNYLLLTTGQYCLYPLILPMLLLTTVQ